MINFPEPHKPEMPCAELHHDDLQRKDHLILIREDGTVIKFTQKEHDTLHRLFSRVINVEHLLLAERELEELRSNASWEYGTQQGSL